MTPHLVVDVTGHGYGHLSQVTPVVLALRNRVPGLRLTVRSLLRAEIVRDFLGEDCGFAPPPPDFGMAMHSPIDVDAERSAEAYAALHAAWPAVVAEEAEKLAALAPTLLLSGVGYAGLAGAARAGLPAVALSSLNWADIYRTYCLGFPGAAAVHGQMLDAYRGARMFLQIEPHLPMTDLPNRRSVGPVARLGTDRRAELADALGGRPSDRFALASLGGIQGPASMCRLPRVPGLRWLADPDLAASLPGRDDVTPVSAVPLRFLDVLRSCDLVVTKPGYGTIVEAVCNGTRVVYCERPDWPETAGMDGWARATGRAMMIGRSDLAEGSYGDRLLALLDGPAPAPVEPSGVAAAAELIAGLLA